MLPNSALAGISKKKGCQVLLPNEQHQDSPGLLGEAFICNLYPSSRMKPHTVQEFIVQEISAISETICSSQKARNIGVTFDNHFLFNDHIASICKSSFYHLRNISYIRKYRYLS